MHLLNLHSSERRLIAGVAIIVFIVLNVTLVRPHFGDWGRARRELKEQRETLALYRQETDPATLAAQEKRELALKDLGSSVVPSEQSLDLIRSLQSLAAQNNVVLTDQREAATATSTNAFFQEKARLISFRAEEKNLVDFLVALGSSSSMIRVRSMSLRPHPDQMHLQGNMTVVASFHKKAPATSSTPVTAPNKTPPLARR